MTRSLAIGLALLAVPSLGTADDVHLINGSVFEGVATEITDTHVIVELAIGRIRLPRAQVLRVVSGTSDLERFRARREELLAASAGAGDWVELAVWARQHGLEERWRETALLAAQIDPGVEQLAPLMREMRYELDEQLGWVPFDVAMRRRGLVEYDGSWLSPERAAELRRLDQQAALERQERAAAERRARPPEHGQEADEVSDNEVALAALDLAREVARGNVSFTLARPAVFAPGYPLLLPALPLSGSFPIVVGGDEGQTGDGPRALSGREGWAALAERQPGSLIPLEQFAPPERRH